MDPVPEWQLPEMKPLHVKAGFLGGLAIAVVCTGLTAVHGGALLDIVEVAVATLVPIVLLTLLAARANRRNPGRTSLFS